MEVSPVHAWLAREWLASNERMKDFAYTAEINPKMVSSGIGEFIMRMNIIYKVDVQWAWGDDKRELLKKLLTIYERKGGKFKAPRRLCNYKLPRFSEAEMNARLEHAWLLRAEGFLLKEIGYRLGVGTERARTMIGQFSRRVRKAKRLARFTVEVK